MTMTREEVDARMIEPTPRKDLDVPPPIGFVTLTHHETVVAEVERLKAERDAEKEISGFLDMANRGLNAQLSEECGRREKFAARAEAAESANAALTARVAELEGLLTKADMALDGTVQNLHGDSVFRCHGDYYTVPWLKDQIRAALAHGKEPT